MYQKEQKLRRLGNATFLRRWPPISRLALILLALGRLRSVAAPHDFRIEPVPDWTTPIDVKEYENPLEKLASGVFILLLETEINGHTADRFFHITEKFLSSPGIVDIAHPHF